MASTSSRRTFVTQTGLLLAGVHAARWVTLEAAADEGNVIAPTSAGRVRGTVVRGVNVFKGISYAPLPPERIASCPLSNRRGGWAYATL